MNCKLSVNINKVALLRNQRTGNFPDPFQFSKSCERLGADGITVHPRPDECHVRYSDVPKLKEINSTELNVEGFPSDRFLQLMRDIRPDQCTLVPDPPGVLTSDTGWDVEQNKNFLREIISELKSLGIRTSLFLNPDTEQLLHAKEIGTDRVELYTGNYAQLFLEDKERAIKDHIAVAELAHSIGMGLNAGHDLNRENLKYYAQNMVNLLEVSIGHAFISDCLYLGLEECVRQYKNCLSI